VAAYFTERAIGHVCRDRFPRGYADDPAHARAIGVALVDTLAALHTVDPESVGLATFGRPAGFLPRQLARWRDQWSRSAPADGHAIDELHGRLAATCPSDVTGRIVHGDYRLDNVMLHPAVPGRVAAVLDWEMSTLGDPLTDLGLLLIYWAQEDDDDLRRPVRMVTPLTARPGFLTRDEVVMRYAEITGVDVSAIDWYVAFAYFKNAVICQGIVARVQAGVAPGVDATLARSLVTPLIAAGLRALDLAS
jgi:aminoglycoside phosphotransferase (APT) family kinase protein